MIKLLVGLGNPGSEYEDTNHNAGFWWLDAVARRRLGHSVLARALEDATRGAFEDLPQTHPAIVMVEIALASALAARGVRPQAVLGVSLGEIAAAQRLIEELGLTDKLYTLDALHCQKNSAPGYRRRQ